MSCSVGLGLAFAHPDRLKLLEKWGHLVLVDNTPNTNKLGWKLFAVMIRDQYGSWLPVAHGLLSNEFGEMISEFLLAVKTWA